MALGWVLLGVVADDDAARIARRRRTAAKDAAEEKKSKGQPVEERVEDYLTVDPMEIELGVGLIRLADPNRGGDLLERVQKVRQNIAGEIGILMPKVRVRDNMRSRSEPVSDQDCGHRGGAGLSCAADPVAGDRLGDDDRQD